MNQYPLPTHAVNENLLTIVKCSRRARPSWDCSRSKARSTSQFSAQGHAPRRTREHEVGMAFLDRSQPRY